LQIISNSEAVCKEQIVNLDVDFLRPEVELLVVITVDPGAVQKSVD